MLIAGAFLLAEAYPVWFWSAAVLFAAYVAWAVVLERRRMDAIRLDEHVPSMSPLEYEHYVGRLLNDAGWNVRHVGGLADQGCDVLAELRGFTAVIQCKLYRKACGNAAVQEIVAARRHYGAQIMAVVCPAGYTRPAQELAHSNGVLLLSHADLHTLERLARVP